MSYTINHKRKGVHANWTIFERGWIRWKKGNGRHDFGMRWFWCIFQLVVDEIDRYICRRTHIQTNNPWKHGYRNCIFILPHRQNHFLLYYGYEWNGKQPLLYAKNKFSNKKSMRKIMMSSSKAIQKLIFVKNLTLD